MSFQELVPEHLRGLGPYAAGKSVKRAQAESGIECVKLASNENPFGPSPAAMEAIRAGADQVNFYPDNDESALVTALAAKHELARDQILVTAGSTSFLDVICRTLLGPGLNAVTSSRSFIQYPLLTRAAGGHLVEAPMQDDRFDLQAVLRAITPATRVVFVANPNNPTGTLLQPGEIDLFLERVPRNLLVVLDEAYADFAAGFAGPRNLEYSHSERYVREGRQVLVLRTFSKAHGLAGLRVGYGFGSAEVISVFARVRTIFSVSGLAEAAALAALSDHTHISRVLHNNAQGAEWLLRELQALGLRALPTWANFVYFDVPEPARELADRLQLEGVIVRPLTAWGAPSSIRVSIGTPEQNELFIRALQRCLAAVSAH
ncbi:MAG: histidinol-phosphate transaminase [Acidobacteria bacterium]|nr:histidinol-phosphate transaminase [Acidobacteriota bacterium]